MNKLKKILRTIFLGDCDIPYFFNKNKNTVNEINSRYLKITTVVCFIVSSIALIAIAFIPTTKKYFLVFAVFTVLFLFAVFASYYFLKNDKRHATLFLELYVSFMYLYGILISFAFLNSVPSPIFYYFLAIIPTILFCPPIFYYSISLSASILYLIIFISHQTNQILITRFSITLLVTFIIGSAVFFLLTKERIQSTKSYQKTHADSSTDDLTNIPNRRAFNKHFETYINDSNKVLSGIIMLDIDDFKIYNDTMGHIAGDKVLEQIGTILKQISEKYQVFVARYGGEEFVAVINYMNLNNINNIALDILRDVRNLNINYTKKGEKACSIVTVSIGVAYATFDDSAMHVLSKADIALYRAKAAGKNQIKII